jgi:uncharacterized membrane protein
MAGAVLSAIALTILLPAEVKIGPDWLFPLVEIVLLALLVMSDPGEITRRSAVLRGLSIGLVAVLACGAAVATVRLIDQLITGGDISNSAGPLLSAGVKVWVGNNLAATLLYWELDAGGAAARAHGMPRYPDLAFPQQIERSLAAPGWRPRFVDYLYLGFTNSLAFSPTDVMPLVPWAKIAMALQAIVSIALLSLVIARAVNVFS